MAQLKTTDLLAIALAAFVLLYQPAAKPTPDTIPVPDTQAQAMVKPITAVLDGHKAEAAELAAFYRVTADMVRRDGAGNKIITTTAQFRVFLERAVTLRFQGAFAKVPGLSEAIHGPSGALSQLLGLDAAELDHAKAANALDAVSWACQEASR